MTTVKLFCLFLIFDVVVCHVIHGKHKPEITSLDYVKKERIHFPRLDYSKTKRQAEQTDPDLITEVFGAGNEEVLDSSNGYGFGRPTHNQDALNGNVPTAPIVELPVTTNPTTPNNRNIGTNAATTRPDINSQTTPRDQPRYRDTGSNQGNMNNNPMTNPVGRPQPNMPNYGSQYPQRQPQAVIPDYSAGYDQQNDFNNNPYVKKPPVYTTNTNAAVNLGFGLPKDNPVVPVHDNVEYGDSWEHSNDHHHRHRPRNHRGRYHGY